MICVSVPSPDSFDNINRWKTEILKNEPEKPVMLILTKADMLSEELKDRQVTYEQIRDAKDSHGLQGCCLTSAKKWQDFNVHKAFVRTICAGYFSKYDQKLG